MQSERTPYVIHIGKCAHYYKSNKWNGDTPYSDMVDFFIRNIFQEFIEYLLKDRHKIIPSDIDKTRNIVLRCECSKRKTDIGKDVDTEYPCLHDLILILRDVAADTMKIWIERINIILFPSIDDVMEDILVGRNDSRDTDNADTALDKVIDFLADKVISGTKSTHPILIEGGVIRVQDRSYSIDSCINVSNSSTVIKAVRNSVPYAIKISTNDIHSKRVIEYEINMVQRLKQDTYVGADIGADIGAEPCYPTIIDTFCIDAYSSNHCCIVMELYGPDLYEYITTKRGSSRFPRGLSMSEIAGIASQIVSSLRHIHACSIIHNDIKLENIVIRKVIRKPDIDSNADRVVLIDYGLSLCTTDEIDKIKEIRGTIAYLSPEELSGSGHSTKSDIWSFGIVMLELLTGTEIMTGDIIENMFIIERIFDYEFTRIHKDIGTMIMYKIGRSRLDKYAASSVGILYDKHFLQNTIDDVVFRDFVERCLCIDPDKRASADELCSHAFLKRD